MIFLCVAAGVVAVALLCADHTVCYGWVCLWMWTRVSECVLVCVWFSSIVHIVRFYIAVCHCFVASSSSRFVCLCAWEICVHKAFFEYATHLNYTHTPFMCTYSFLSSSSALFSLILLEFFSVSLEIYDILICKRCACIKFMCLKTTFHSLFGRLCVCVCVQNAIKNSFRV